MWTFSHTEQTTATPEQLWEYYASPSDWTLWDHGLTSVEFDGPMRAGAVGRLKPHGGPATKFTVTEVTPMRSFTDTTRLPGARLDFSHTLEPFTRGTRVTHGLTITGPMTFFFRRVIGTPSARDLPQAIRRLVALAEGRSASA